MKVVYILDQVRALEHEMLQRIKQQGLDITPRILIVMSKSRMFSHNKYPAVDPMFESCFCFCS